MKRIYVDVDGTLLDSSLDKSFINSGYNVEEYDKQYVDTLAVNYNLVKELKEYKDKGYELVLWTNRHYTQYIMTINNLGDVWDIFDEHRFYGGKKLGTNTDGITIDNEPKYVINGILITDF
jgi:FMN phosphatase YigB (HAD superfamily)